MTRFPVLFIPSGAVRCGATLVFFGAERVAAEAFSLAKHPIRCYSVQYMPTIASPVPWHDVEQLIRAGIGVRETARRMGLSEERVKRQCSRKGWLAAAQAPAKALSAAQNALAETTRAVCPQVPTAAEVLAGIGGKTRAALANGLLRASEHVETLEGREVLREAQNVASIVKSASAVHGWQDQDGRSSGPVLVNIDLRGQELPEKPVITVDAPDR